MLPKGFLPWHPRDKERLPIVDELWRLLGTENPDSYVNTEPEPSEANGRLHATLLQLPLEFTQRLLNYARNASQRDRDLLQITLRYVRHAGKNPRSLLNDAEVRRVELYLSGLPIFNALTTGDCREIGMMIVNHAESTKWEAHKDARALSYSHGYFFYSVLWPKAPLPRYDDLLWLDGNALELSPYGDILKQRGRFDRGFCELLLASSAPAVRTGVL